MKCCYWPVLLIRQHGLKSIYKKCIDSWNMISEINRAKKKDLKIDLLKMYSRNELKTTVTKHILSVYHGELIFNL